MVVADSSYSVLELLKFCQSMAQPVTFVTRLRLDAALHEPAPPRRPGQRGRPRIVGMRLPTLKSLLEAPTTVCQLTCDHTGVTDRLGYCAVVQQRQGTRPHTMGLDPRSL